jgi:16S rRNA (cytosine967-C5)-methyltransferase
MLVGRIADPKENWDVLDTCSAPGGKTAHLAESMGNKGHIDALDANDVRLKMVEQTAERLGLSIISTMHYDCTYLKEETEKLLREYDLVLCDVPCSGLGLLHRKPDIRLSMSYEKMQDLLPVQESILENSCLRVKKGGFLIYSTCTINPNENEKQVEAFLSRHEDFECVPFTDLLPEKLENNPRLAMESGKGMMTILPDEEGMDGFFIAKMRRKN